MSFGTIILIIGLFLIIDAAVVGAIMHSAASTLNTLADPHPARPPAPSARRKNFQSLSIGVYNFGGCVHLAIDRFGIHLFPALLPRLAGARPASIPWSEVQITSRGKRQSTIRVGSNEFTGPTWAFAPDQPPAD